MTRSIARLAGFAALLVLLAGCDGSTGEAQNGCTLGTLRGNYIYAVDGFLVAGGTASERVPFAQAGREFFYGDGTMSGFGTLNVNGQVTRVAYSGTYTVDGDCTGSVVFTDNEGTVSHYDVAIEDGGAEFGFVQTDDNVVSAAFERRRTSSDDSCSQSTLRGNYVYAGDGFDLPGPGTTQRTPFATAGREVYNGEGGITGIDTTSTNGVIARSTYTASYSMQTDCHASYAYATDPANPYELFADPSGAEFAYVATGAKRVAAGYERRR